MSIYQYIYQSIYLSLNQNSQIQIYPEYVDPRWIKICVIHSLHYFLWYIHISWFHNSCAKRCSCYMLFTRCVIQIEKCILSWRLIYKSEVYLGLLQFQPPCFNIRFFYFQAYLKVCYQAFRVKLFHFFQHFLFGSRGNYTSLLFIIGSAMWHLLNTTHIKLRCKMHCIALLHIIIPKKIWKIDTHVYVAFFWWWIYKLQ